MTLPTIGMFWEGAPLSFVERLCLTSFRDVGHPVVLFSYSKVEGVPEGIQTASASDILPNPETMIRHERSGSPAPFSDKFRYHLLHKNDGMIWSDTDAYCLKPFTAKNGYFFGWESNENRKIANGVMAVPAASPTLRELIAFCADEYSIPPWMRPVHAAQMRERAAAGDPLHVSQMQWGVWGPKAFSWFLKENDEIKHALDAHILYPVPFSDRRAYFRKAKETWDRVSDDTVSIHFYGRRVRDRLAYKFEGLPPENSILAELGRKHGIAPDGPNAT